MKVKATIVLLLNTKEIMAIHYEDDVLNHCLGSAKIKSYIKKRVLQTPVQDFRMVCYFKSLPNVYFLVTDMEIEVYPHILKIKNPMLKREIPYRCTLFPSPDTRRESDISFEKYSQFKEEYYKRKSLKAEKSSTK